MAWPVNAAVAKIHGTGRPVHYDVMNVWDDKALDAMVASCLNAARGRDDQQPAPYQLNTDYLLP
jgi:hypothetical protein